MKVLPIPCHFDNYAWLLLCEKEGEAILIDPSEAVPILHALNKHNAKLAAIYCTHHHHDHTGGLLEIRRKTGVEHIFCHLEDSKDQDRIPQAADFLTPLQEGDTFTFCGQKGEVLHTPGHTKGSCCYHIGGCLFTGDTLFSAGCGRLFEGEPAQMAASLQKIAALPEKTKICFAHEYTLKNLQFALSLEPENRELLNRYTDVLSLREKNLPTAPSTLAIEKKTNPFLRTECPALQELYASTDAVEVFTALREARDIF